MGLYPGGELKTGWEAIKWDFTVLCPKLRFQAKKIRNIFYVLYLASLRENLGKDNISLVLRFVSTGLPPFLGFQTCAPPDV